MASVARQKNQTMGGLAIEVAELRAAHVEAWKAFPAHLAAAIAEAVKELAKQSDHDSLADRVKSLEDARRQSEAQHAYSAGATKAEQRGEDRLHKYMVAGIPYFLVLAALVYQYAGAAG